jgi:hypothetical protein
MSDVATEKVRARFFEGGSGVAVAVIPVVAILCAVFYQWIVAKIAPFDVKIEDVYTYVFNLFAIEFAALLGLFALFVCRPTPFLERMRNTHAFASIIASTKITMGVVTAAIAVTFVFGILRIAPDKTLTVHSALFLVWAAFASITTAFYGRTVRLIFLSLH